MITFLFFTHNQAHALARSLAPLVHDAIEGHVAEVIVVDSGSTDSTPAIAEGAGCTSVNAGTLLRDIVKDTRADWLIVLEPGARLDDGWHGAVMDHIMHPGSAAARFKPQRKGNWFEQWFRPAIAKRGPLARGLVISKRQALANLSETAVGAEDLVRGLALAPLDAEIEMAPKVH
ncbi:glycosyltransferase [Oricola sp.]|uniref:glycosyltransferase n=1 Tax=Oricola sp. TaxID=1979950 RepID=UPI003511FC15